MKQLVFSLVILIPFYGFSQAESEAYKQVAAQFETHYNAENYEKIFKLFSTEMKSALPLEQTTAFLKGLQIQAGKIQQRTFLQYENQTYAAYKTKFERSVLKLLISLDSNSDINGLLIKPLQENLQSQLKRNKTDLVLPFKEEWTVVWGGDTRELNYHVENPAQKNAFDFVITDENGKSYKTNGKTNEDYYAFGKELFSPCAAEVVQVVDGLKDNTPGQMNPLYVLGNSVILKTENNEYLFFAHFKQHSIVVQQGQQVEPGQLLGLCGNSGNSSEAHLHFHIQNIEDINNATGVKCFFNELSVNGEVKNDYSPIKGDRIKNLD